jgi:hypothetical protein
VNKVSTTRGSLWRANVALPPHSAERLCLSGVGTYELMGEAMPQASGGGASDNHFSRCR